MDSLYTLENAKQFGWSSISGDLNPERVAHLQKYLVGQKILDAGCGGGAFVDFLTEQGLDVTGVDKHDQFLEVAREQKRRGCFVEGDLTALDFADKTFDCTYCFDVLEHIDDFAALKQLARVTKRRIILAVPKEDEDIQPYNVTFAHYRDKTHLRNYTEDSLRELTNSISHAKFDIFPELCVNAKGLVSKLILQNYAGGLSNRTAQTFFRELLDQAEYAMIYTGLVAIIDLD